MADDKVCKSLSFARFHPFFFSLVLGHLCRSLHTLQAIYRCYFFAYRGRRYQRYLDLSSRPTKPIRFSDKNLRSSLTLGENMQDCPVQASTSDDRISFKNLGVSETAERKRVSLCSREVAFPSVSSTLHERRRLRHCVGSARALRH